MLGRSYRVIFVITDIFCFALTQSLRSLNTSRNNKVRTKTEKWSLLQYTLKNEEKFKLNVTFAHIFMSLHFNPLITEHIIDYKKKITIPWKRWRSTTFVLYICYHCFILYDFFLYHSIPNILDLDFRLGNWVWTKPNNTVHSVSKMSAIFLQP